MSACHDLRPLLGAYVLGALEPEEAAEVRAHVLACPGCAAEHSRLAPLPGLLTLAAGAEAAAAEPPPAALEERLLDAVAREAAPDRDRRRNRRRWLWAGGGLAAVAATAVVALVLSLGGSNGYGVKLQASAAAPQGRAWASLDETQGGTKMQLWVEGMPHDPGTVYEVKCDSPSWSASAGTFRVGTDGKAFVTLTSAARLGEYQSIHIVRRGDDRVVFSAALQGRQA